MYMWGSVHTLTLRLPEKWSLTADTVVHPHFSMVKVDPTKGLKTHTTVRFWFCVLKLFDYKDFVSAIQ